MLVTLQMQRHVCCRLWLLYCKLIRISDSTVVFSRRNAWVRAVCVQLLAHFGTRVPLHRGGTFAIFWIVDPSFTLLLKIAYPITFDEGPCKKSDSSQRSAAVDLSQREHGHSDVSLRHARSSGARRLIGLHSSLRNRIPRPDGAARPPLPSDQPGRGL